MLCLRFGDGHILVFPLGELGTFALFKLPAFLWVNFVENESKLLEMLKVLTEFYL